MNNGQTKEIAMTHTTQNGPFLSLGQRGDEQVTITWVGGLEDGRFVDVSSLGSKRLTPEQSANLATIEVRMGVGDSSVVSPNYCDTDFRRMGATIVMANLK